MLSTIIIFILILSLLVFVHEFGHFITAKKMGVRVEEFGFGFPPRIWGKKKGDTTYSVNWIPLGGFVRLKGEAGDHKNDGDSFAAKKIWQKIIILASGVFMNFVLAIVLISIGFSIGFPEVLDGNIKNYKSIRDEKINIAFIEEGMPAKEAGIKEGDVINKIDGIALGSIEEIQEYITSKGDEKIVLELQREDEAIQKELSAIKVPDEESGEKYKYIMGVGLIKTGIVSYPVHTAFYKGAQTTFILVREILRIFYELFRNMIVKGDNTLAKQFSGPVGIAVITGKMAKLGFIYLLQFIAILSINLGIINFMPFPALDGGRILFLTIEKIRGKAVNENIENLIHNVGFVLLLGLVVVITFKDIFTYRSSFIDFFKNIF